MAERRVRSRNEDFIVITDLGKLANLDAQLMEGGIHPDNFRVEFEDY